MGSTPPYLVRLQLKEGAADSGEYPFSLPLIRCLDSSSRRQSPSSLARTGLASRPSSRRLLLYADSQCRAAVGTNWPAITVLIPQARSRGPFDPSFRRRPPDAYFLRAEFQAHFASLLDARNADPDFTMWGDPYARYGGRSLHTVPMAKPFCDSPESDSIWAPAVRRARVSALTSASTGAPRAHVRAGGSRQVTVHHRDSFANSPDVSRCEILSFDGDALNPISLEDTSHFQITKGILQNPAVYWKHLQDGAAAEEESVETQPRESKRPRARRSNASGS